MSPQNIPVSIENENHPDYPKSVQLMELSLGL